MSCIEDVKKQLIKEAKDAFIGPYSTAIDEVGNTLIVNYGKSYKNKDLKSALSRTYSGVNRVASYVSDKYGKKFSGGWTTINNYRGIITVDFKIPNIVNKALQVKFQDKSLYQANVELSKEEIDIIDDLNTELRPEDEYLSSDKRIFDKPGEVYYQNNTNQSDRDYIASEKTIRDLAERMADRIGLKVRYESDRTRDYKGKLEGNTAVINLAYTTLDTPIHEILSHPIIRALKTGSEQNIKLYQNLLKELEAGKGKEVLDRVKRDYQYKTIEKTVIDSIEQEKLTLEGYKYVRQANNQGDLVYGKQVPYTIEEQQEEAIVELVSLMAAGKIQENKDTKNLLSLLKQLWLEMSNFIKSLLSKKEVDISKDLDNIQQLSEDKLIEFMKKGLIKEDCK